MPWSLVQRETYREKKTKQERDQQQFVAYRMFAVTKKIKEEISFLIKCQLKGAYFVIGWFCTVIPLVTSVYSHVAHIVKSVG